MLAKDEVFSMRQSGDYASFRRNLVVTHGGTMRRLDIENYSAALQKELARTVPERKVLEVKTLAIDGRTCWRIDSRFRSGDRALQQVCWIVPDPDASFVLTFTCTADEFPDVIGPMERAVQAIQLGGAPAPKGKTK